VGGAIFLQQRREEEWSPPAGLLSDENVLGPMRQWQAAGRRVALVTLVEVEGGAPRQVGAQMAVAEDGRYAGYLSGGCLEEAVALEAQAAIAQGANRLLRYGKGSPYFDIRLPCGTGLGLYFDQALDAPQLASMMQLQASRTPFVLRTDLSSGVSHTNVVDAGTPIAASRRVGDIFERVYPPRLQLLLLGSGPALVSIAAVAATLGIELLILSHDEAVRAALGPFEGHRIIGAADLKGVLARLDFASAAVLVFHDHEKELDYLAELLKTDCYYIGALGSRTVHADRLDALAPRCDAKTDLGRIRAPVGSIPGAKSKATLAIGVLMEMMAEAKARNLIT
jgi:xanthine dehydrogenase accessory factor